MEPDDDPGIPEDPSRARRAKALGGVSLLVVAFACAAYLRPAPQPAAPAPTAAAGYQLDAVDFVDPATGWVIADINSSEFAVISTKDAGRSWATRLVSPSTSHGEYMRFFDRSRGVVVSIGGGAGVFGTADGGAHWTRHAVEPIGGYVISASFVDLLHGWLLEFGAGGGGLASTELMRTEDGGSTWKNLGPPAPVSAEAFAVSFTNGETGWLDAVASGPYAYKTADGGATWRQVTLPAPASGWPLPHGSFFVAARPTLGNGVVVTVVNSAYINGRSAAGSSVLIYPPLTMRTFDGGSPVVYIYTTFVDSASDGLGGLVGADHKPGPATQVPPASQIGLRSTDGGVTWTSFVPPASGGTIGYADALSWWWVGPGVRSTSTDGGLTWSPSQPDAIGDPLAGSLVALDSKHAWVSALGDTVPLLFTTSDGGDHWTSVRLPQAFT
jgi:hypothetical protein